MMEARLSLLEGCSVKETAAAIGYRTSSHFSKTYKKHFGISPSSARCNPPPPTKFRSLQHNSRAHCLHFAE